MKKFLSVLLSLLFVLSLVSCDQSRKQNESADNNIEDSKNEIIKIDDIDALTWDTYEQKTFYRNTVFGEKHYKTETEFSVNDPKACVEAFASVTASSDFKTLFEKSDRVDMLPIVGYFFQTTDLAVVVFYDDNVKIGAIIVQLGETLSEIKNTFDYNSTEMNNSFLGFKDKFSPEGCLERINDTESYFKGFTVTALMFNVSESLGNGVLLCLGKYENDESLYVHHYMGVIDIPYIGKVTSIKEAREKYAEFKVFEREQYKSLKLFKWWDVPSNYMSGGYAHCVDYPSFLKTGEYEWYLEVGLLNGEYKSDEYVWGLVYDGSKLIAEVIVHKDKETSDLEVIIMTDAQKDENGEYVAQSSKLIDLFNKAKATDENIDIVGIQYDGSDISILYRQDDTVLKYK